MSVTFTAVQVAAAVSGALYAVSVSTVALAAVLGRDPRRRSHARATLEILLRHPPRR
jgi:hypothetical protein